MIVTSHWRKTVYTCVVDAVCLHCRFISIPKDMGTFNCGAFVAGIVRVCTALPSLSLTVKMLLKDLLNLCIFFYCLKGVLDSAGFPAVVSAHFVPVEGQQRPRTTILIKFAEEVISKKCIVGVSFFSSNILRNLPVIL